MVSRYLITAGGAIRIVVTRGKNLEVDTIGSEKQRMTPEQMAELKELLKRCKQPGEVK